MRLRSFILLLSMLILLPVLAFGQLKEQTKPQPFSKLLTQSPGLAGLIGLNPNRFSMQQSYSLSYMSLSGHGFSNGVYLNTMSYQLADPLLVSFQWGMMNQPLGSFGVPSLYQNGFFVSGASVEYKPSRNLSIGVQFNHNPRGFWSPQYGYPYYNSSLQPATPRREDKADQ
jgi:hypothetical protein